MPRMSLGCTWGGPDNALLPTLQHMKLPEGSVADTSFRCQPPGKYISRLAPAGAWLF